MPRALSTHGLHFPVEQREAVMASLRERKAQLRQHDCNFWVFEDRTLPGVMIEFYEARDGDTLARAREAAGVDPRGQPILSEVEL
ncbi:MAG: hypothetical protein ACT4P7_14220 [Gemmatimonadaceae bacterium]